MWYEEGPSGDGEGVIFFLLRTTGLFTKYETI